MLCEVPDIRYLDVIFLGRGAYKIQLNRYPIVAFADIGINIPK